MQRRELCWGVGPPTLLGCPAPVPDPPRTSRGEQGHREDMKGRHGGKTLPHTPIPCYRVGGFNPLALISLGCHAFLVLYAREGNPLKIPPQQGTGLPPWNINQTDGTWEEGPYCNLTTQTQRKSIMLRVREHAYILSSKYLTGASA